MGSKTKQLVLSRISSPLIERQKIPAEYTIYNYTLYDSLYMFRYYANTLYTLNLKPCDKSGFLCYLQPLGTSRFFFGTEDACFSENNILRRLQGGTLSSAMLQLHGGQGFGIGTLYKTVSDRRSGKFFVFLFMLFIPFFCKKNILKLFFLF